MCRDTKLLRGQKVDFVNVKPGGMHWELGNKRDKQFGNAQGQLNG
jgi:hypothetical protein